MLPRLLILVIQLKMLTKTETLMKLKKKLIMTSLLLLKNLIS